MRLVCNGLFVACVLTLGAAYSQLQYNPGQWAGPYQLPIGAGMTTPTFEIAHIAVLPPPHGLGYDRVLFGVVPGGTCAGIVPPFELDKYGRTYLWHPRVPTNVTLIDTPYPQGGPADATQDFFCGGHTFLPDGDLLWVGGTDPVTSCESGTLAFAGHAATWRLDIEDELLDWVSAGDMFQPRWYPTATLLLDGKVMVTGHDNQPNENADRERDIYEIATNTWLQGTAPSGAWPNLIPDPQCLETNDIELQDYPRLHVLESGWVIQTNATVGPAHHPTNMPTRFMDLSSSCSNPRWEDAAITSTQRLNGSSVHLVAWTPGLNGDFTEVIYLVGGAEEALELESDCAAAPPGDYFATTEKMVEPAVGAVWSAGPTLNLSRVQHNTVILLDGSLLTVGGQAVDTVGTCEARRIPERYRTFEVFDNPSAGWAPMAAQAVDRRYHSVAALLPDGRVVSAGGQATAASSASEHSVEIYSPPYFFKGPRPVIDETALNEPHFDPYLYGGSLTFRVDLGNIQKQIDRVALLRNGTATHAFDMSQRYVELEIVNLQQDPEALESWDVTVNIPPLQDQGRLPEGFYMLTVVDTDNVPSEASWIRVES